ncbi:MAG TPA: UvrD-helicase domain-containing protein [Aliidongia sp.]|uniref:ATP-dependent helicase n=1 Tax=Aliidongia sp. TaxID=1914230 RepID=UPI002DDD5098|nr:UvrD-helicase domain-containing protein [Aliidongia sp.]HEV2676675.1 UvrD-helicase domain-containing protein [Aliidongia sp.]
MSLMSDRPGEPSYFANLNPPQREAVETLDGPVLVLAGAGTGKTRVLTTRLGHILMTGRAYPSQVLAVTFTNKAAREMRDRLERLIGADSEGMWLGTFHALAARILRRHAEAVGLKSNFTILDTDDQIRLIKQLLVAEGIDDKRSPARAVLATIERWKDRGLTPDKVDGEDAGELADGRMVALYRQYQERLRVLNATDFGDLLLHNLTIFLGQPAILADYQRKFRYLLVDEYQDTNVSQYLWLRLLAQTHRNICCVGDDDQSIYGWRGAEVGNILRFEADFPGAVIIRLEQNYRSTPEILNAAGHLIAHNNGRLGKTLWTAGEAGERVRVKGMWDGEEEARWVADEIETDQRQGTRLSEIAVLVRASFQMREFEERFITTGIPYRVIGGPRFYERQEIRDALAYLRLIYQPDDDLAFERIVNTPRRGIGNATMQTLHALGRATGVSLMEAARRVVETDELKPASRKAVALLVRDFDRWRRESDRILHTELAQIVLDESGYTAMWQADKTPEAPGRLENLKELIVGMAEFETLAGFLEHVSLVMDNAADAGGDLVSLMTLHAAKGLEFGHVFLPGWEEGLFPHQRALDETGQAGLEEERRLAYVGLTRAKQRADVSYAANRRIHGQWQSSLPSRFVEELPQDQIEAEAATGMYGMRAPAGRGAFDDIATSAFGGYRRIVRPMDGGGPREGREIRAVGGFHEGDRVFHQKFGTGTVREVEDAKLTIDFDHAGEKRVMDSFVQKA